MKVCKAYYYWRVYRCWTSGYETWIKPARQDKFSWPRKRLAREVFSRGRTWSDPVIGTMVERRKNVIYRLRRKSFSL